MINQGEQYSNISFSNPAAILRIPKNLLSLTFAIKLGGILKAFFPTFARKLNKLEEYDLPRNNVYLFPSDGSEGEEVRLI